MRGQRPQRAKVAAIDRQQRIRPVSGREDDIDSVDQVQIQARVTGPDFLCLVTEKTPGACRRAEASRGTSPKRIAYNASCYKTTVSYHLGEPPTELAPLLSAERLETYCRHAPACERQPVELYLLGVELAASYMADLVLARLFGFWIHLLEAGGHVGQPPYRRRRSYDELLWKPAVHRAFPQSTGRRVDVHTVTHRVYALRNRVAHHEPVIAGVRIPGTARNAPNSSRTPRDIHSDIVMLLRWVSEPVGAWLANHSHSRTPALLEHRRQSQ